MALNLETAESHLDVADTPHGTSIPLELFLHYLPRGLLMEFGGGTGEKAKLLQRSGYGVQMTDISREAVQISQDKGLNADIKDACTFQLPDWGIGSISQIELYDGVYFQGLMPSLLSESWKQALVVADMNLHPDGYLFMSDVQPSGEPNARFDYRFDQAYRVKFAQDWERRYQANTSLGLPRHTFIVGKPGPAKELEWGNPADLQCLLESDQFERLSQHVPFADIQQQLTRLNLEIVYFEPKVWSTRVPGRYLPGYVLVAKKGPRFKYHPWRVGLTSLEWQDVKEHYDWARHADLTYEMRMTHQLQQLVPYPLAALFPAMIELANHGEQFVRYWLKNHLGET